MLIPLSNSLYIEGVLDNGQNVLYNDKIGWTNIPDIIRSWFLRGMQGKIINIILPAENKHDKRKDSKITIANKSKEIRCKAVWNENNVVHATTATAAS